MLGSLHDAEDFAQDTIFRAWRRLDGFQGPSTFRSWIYRIATNACLNHLESRRREPAPAAKRNGSVPHPDLVLHLEPFPDVLLDGLDRAPARGPPRKRATSCTRVSLWRFRWRSRCCRL